jgi:hypothetical protein
MEHRQFRPKASGATVSDVTISTHPLAPTGGGQERTGFSERRPPRWGEVRRDHRATNIPNEEETQTMTNSTAATNLTPFADDANEATPERYRQAKRPVLKAPAAPRLRGRHHPNTSRSDDRPRRVEVPVTASSSLTAGDPTVPKKPVAVAEALAETRHYIDASAGPDRAQDAVELRARVAESADLVEFLTQVHYQLSRARDAAGSPTDDSTGIAANIRQEQARLRRAENALQDAETAQRSRQAWLDAHPETLAHLDDLRARAQRRPRRRSIA